MPDAIDLPALRRAAEAATPGPWTAMAKPEPSRVDHGYRLIATCTSPTSIAVYTRRENMKTGIRGGWQWGDDASYIAMLDPQTVLRLLDVAEAAIDLSRQFAPYDGPEFPRLREAVRALTRGEG